MIRLSSVLLLLCTAQGIFFSLVLLGLPKRNRANHWLSLFLITFSIGMIGTVLYDEKLVLAYPAFGLIHTVLAPLNGISVYLYIRALTDPQFRFKGKQWLHFLPVLVSIGLIMPYFTASLAEKRHLLEASYDAFPLWWRVNFAFAALVNGIYIFVTFLTIYQHEGHIKRLYSNLQQKSLRWISNFIYSGAIIFCLCVAASFIDIAWADRISNLLFGLLVYVLGYRAFGQAEIFSDLPPEVVAETVTPPEKSLVPKYEKSGLTIEKAQVLLTRLEKLFEVEQIYLQADLTLQQLADQLNTSSHQISQLLNQFKEKNFFDFVNGYRVTHFKQALANPANAHLSILAIALDSGFNSKATFNEVFKKMTGQTPSAFRKNLPSQASR